MAGVKEEQERAAFERDMTTHVAQLVGFAKPYTSRLPKRELTKFMALALDQAWFDRAFLGTHLPLLQWWGQALRRAAIQGGPWTQVYSHKTITISGRELGREESV